MARILFLSHRVPYPPNKGDKIRSFHEIRYLSRSHEIHLLAFCDRSSELAYADELRRYCRSVTLFPIRRVRQRINAVRSMFRGEPWTLGYYADPRMLREVRAKLSSAQFDLVFAFSSSMAPYALSTDRLPRVLDFVDSDASKWRQYALFKPWPSKWLYSYESDRLADFEKRMVQKFDRCIFVSAREARHLEDWAEKILFVQNGIDIDFYTSPPPKPSAPQVIFVGAMDYFPNIDAVCYFAREILPRIREKRDIRFLIVGSNPSPSVKRLARIPGITVTGAVDDVRPYLRQSGVAVVPNRIAQGIQNKILEALAAGLPVVATPAAAQGLRYTDGLTIAIADDAADFACKVLRFMEQPVDTDRRFACHEYLKRYYSWATNLASFDGILDQLNSGRDIHARR